MTRSGNSPGRSPKTLGDPRRADDQSPGPSMSVNTRAGPFRDLIIERREWSEAKVQRYERPAQPEFSTGSVRRSFLAARAREWGPYLTLDARDLIRGRKPSVGQAGAGDRRNGVRGAGPFR